MENKGGVGILVVDMQAFWLESIGDKRGLFVRNLRGFLDRAHNIGEDASFWYAEYYGKGKTIRPTRIGDTYCKERIVKKNGRDAFVFSDLGDRLRSENVSEVVVSGVCAARCVLETIEGGVRDGFSIVTSGDIVTMAPYSDFDYINRYVDFGARVCSSEDILSYIDSRNR